MKNQCMGRIQRPWQFIHTTQGTIEYSNVWVGRINIGFKFVNDSPALTNYPDTKFHSSATVSELHEKKKQKKNNTDQINVFSCL